MKSRVLSLLAAAMLASAAGPVRAGAVQKTFPSFLPENTLQIPVGFSAAGLKENQFNLVLDRVQAVYGPIVEAKGGHLVIERHWDDPTVNAYASEDGKDWKIAMFGGLARHPTITENAFYLVACHELGHHLGGHPKISGNDWATNEGGADYYSTLKCLRRVLPASAPWGVDPVAAKACNASFRDRASRNRCKASAMAGLAAATLFQQLSETGAVSFTTPDPSVVSAMDDSHPAAQCRLDTYFQGALCAKPVDQDVSNADANAGACTRKQGFSVGLRPRCWYKPPADEPAALELASHFSKKDVEGIQARLESLRAAFGGK